jgi:hypothetical protein
MWFVGIDWGDRAHEIAAVDEHGGSGGTLHIAQTADGLQELIHWLLALSARGAGGDEGKPTGDPERIACLVETSAGLLVTALLDAGFAVYPVNPKTLGRRRNPAGAKTDQIDALLLARLGRSDLAELRRLTLQSPLVEELRGLTRDQDHLIQLQTHLLNQLTACLKAAYPAGLTLFSKLQQRATLLFLQRYPSLAEAQTASVGELVAFLRTMPYFPGALVVAQRIYTRLHAAACGTTAGLLGDGACQGAPHPGAGQSAASTPRADHGLRCRDYPALHQPCRRRRFCQLTGGGQTARATPLGRLGR